MKKKGFKYLNFLRVILCFSVLFYHLKFLKGGYLAVCSFLVVSGYLSYISSSKSKKFSIKDYYKKRLVRIYIPMFIVLGLTTCFLKIFGITWINIKKESLSILFGYNNIWQMLVNSNYFAKALTSPFTHYWYISLLIQFDLLFPLLYVFIKKFKRKKEKKIPIIILSLVSLISLSFFIILLGKKNVSLAYYHPLARVYPLIVGVLLGYLHTNYKKKIKQSINKHSALIFILYLFITLLGFVLVSNKIVIMGISMLVITLVTCRLLDYILFLKEKKSKYFDTVINYLSSISYELYLVQLPIIFIFDEYNTNFGIRILTMLVISAFLHYALNANFKEQISVKKAFRFSALFIISLLTIYGFYYLVTCENYAEEIKKLENHIKENEVLMLEKQKAFKVEEDFKLKLYSSSIEEIDLKINNLDKEIKNLTISGIGDSVMLGALDELYKTFPNGYFDAKINRTAWVASDVINSLKNKNKLGNIVVINLGANGDCPSDCKKNLLSSIADREIFWLNIANNKANYINNMLNDLANDYPNLHIIDWSSISEGHNDYFVADKIHLTSKGAKAYSKAIYDNIYKYYLNIYETEKRRISSDYDDIKKHGYEFYGNELLLNVYNLISSEYENCSFHMNKKYSVDEIIVELKKSVKTNIVFVFDKNAHITSDDYLKIIREFQDKKIYIVLFDINIINKLSTYQNVYVIDMSKIADEYYMFDNVNLNAKGNNYLKDEMSKILKP